MQPLEKRLENILSNQSIVENTGMRKKSTPILAGLKRTIMAGGIGSVMMLSACAPGQNSVNLGRFGTIDGNEMIGAGIGAGIGAVAGAALSKNPLLAVGGAILGGLAGGKLTDILEHKNSPSMFKSDAQIAAQAMNQSLNSPYNRAVNWSNPQTGSHGAYIAGPWGRTENGVPCRTLVASGILNGQAINQTATVCKDRSGSFRVMNDQELRGVRFGENEAVEPVSNKFG